MANKQRKRPPHNERKKKSRIARYGMTATEFSELRKKDPAEAHRIKMLAQKK